MRMRLEEAGDLDEAIVGDLRTASLTPASYDVVFSSFVLEHVEGVEDVSSRLVPTRPGDPARRAAAAHPRSRLRLRFRHPAQPALAARPVQAAHPGRQAGGYAGLRAVPAGIRPNCVLARHNGLLRFARPGDCRCLLVQFLSPFLGRSPGSPTADCGRRQAAPSAGWPLASRLPAPTASSAGPSSARIDPVPVSGITGMTFRLMDGTLSRPEPDQSSIHQTERSP